MAATSGLRKPDGQFDLPRAKEGGLKALFFSVFVTENYYPARYETKLALRMIDAAPGQIAKNANAIELAHNAEIEAIRKRGRMAAVLGVDCTASIWMAISSNSRIPSPGRTVPATFRAQLE
jgi:membrane dipeptidase